MGSFTVFVISYLLGGVTLIPLLIAALLVFSTWYLPYVDTTNDDHEGNNNNNKKGLSIFQRKTKKMEDESYRAEMAQFFSDYEDSDDDSNAPATTGDDVDRGSNEQNVDKDTGIALSLSRTGWITITREYFIYPDGGPNGESGIPAQSTINASESAYSSLYKLITKDKTDTITANMATEKLLETEKNANVVGVVDGKSITSTTLPSSSSAVASTLSSTSIASTSTSVTSSNSFFNSSSKDNPNKKTKKSLRKHKFFYVLKNGNLFLYKDEEIKDVQQGIVISNYTVSLWPPDQVDAQLFIKRTAIFLKKIVPKGSNSTMSNNTTGMPSNSPNSFYLFLDNCYEKEDLYHDLIKASKASAYYRHCNNNYNQGIPNPRVLAQPMMYKETDMILLIQKLHSSKASIQTRWLNAIIGRLFLGLYKSAVFRDAIEAKIIKKLSKIKKPGFLSEIQVRNISVGNAAPLITHPKLQELTPEGHLVAGFHLDYRGCLTLEVETSVNINLGSRFKARQVALILAVTVEELEGDIQLIIKEPPTNRIWYAFTRMPRLKLVIEPVVSSRQITYSMVTKTIDSKIRQAIKESLVLPFMDDIVFASTEGEVFPGGIWDPSVRKEDNNHEDDILQDLTGSPELSTATATHRNNDGESEGGLNENNDLTGDDDGFHYNNNDNNDDNLAAATIPAQSHRKKSMNEFLVPMMSGSGRGSSSNRPSSLSVSSVSPSVMSLKSTESVSSLAATEPSKVSRSSTGSSSSTLESTVKATSALGSKLAKKIRKTANSASALLENTTRRDSESESGDDKPNDTSTVKRWGNFFSEKKNQIKQKGFGSNGENGKSEEFDDVKSLSSLSSSVSRSSSSRSPSSSSAVGDRIYQAPAAHNFPPEMLSLINQDELIDSMRKEDAKTTTTATTMATSDALSSTSNGVQHQQPLISNANTPLTFLGSISPESSTSSKFSGLNTRSRAISNVDPYQPMPAMSVPKKYPVPSHHHHSPLLAAVNIQGQRMVPTTETTEAMTIDNSMQQSPTGVSNISNEASAGSNESIVTRSKSVRRKPVGGYNNDDNDKDNNDDNNVNDNVKNNDNIKNNDNVKNDDNVKNNDNVDNKSEVTEIKRDNNTSTATLTSHDQKPTLLSSEINNSDDPTPEVIRME